MADNIEKAARAHQLNPEDLLHDKVYTMVDRIVYPNGSLRNIHETHCRAQPEACCFFN